MNSEGSIFFALLILSTVLAAVCFFTVWYRSKMDQRTSNLRDAQFALEMHYAAVNKILDDPAPSFEFKQGVAVLSYAISHRRVAAAVANAFFDKSLFDNSTADSDTALKAELELLRKTRPDLCDAFDTSFSTGLVALFLRWPENSAILHRIQAEVASSKQKKISLANHLRKLVRSDGDNDNDFLNGTGHSIPMGC
jgi:hypothetical protein